MEKLLTVKEVSAIVGLSVSTIFREVKRGTFPKAVAVSKARRAWRREDIAAWRAALNAA